MTRMTSLVLPACVLTLLLTPLTINDSSAASIRACNVSGDPSLARRGYTGMPATLEPVRYREIELCVAVPAQVIITKWACEFAKDGPGGGVAQLCTGFGNGSCDVIGWVWPSSSRVYSAGNFNYYCLTGHQDSDREWRYFNIHLYNDKIK